MRKIVNLNKPKERIVRLMIYNDDDCSSEFDELYQSKNEVFESCEMEYGVKKSEWKEIPNP